MDIYRALNTDVPQTQLTLMHQAGPTISDEDYTRTVTARHHQGQAHPRKQFASLGAGLIGLHMH